MKAADIVTLMKKTLEGMEEIPEPMRSNVSLAPDALNGNINTPALMLLFLKLIMLVLRSASDCIAQAAPDQKLDVLLTWMLQTGDGLEELSRHASVLLNHISCRVAANQDNTLFPARPPEWMLLGPADSMTTQAQERMVEELLSWFVNASMRTHVHRLGDWSLVMADWCRLVRVLPSEASEEHLAMVLGRRLRGLLDNTLGGASVSKGSSLRDLALRSALE